MSEEFSFIPYLILIKKYYLLSMFQIWVKKNNYSYFMQYICAYDMNIKAIVDKNAPEQVKVITWEETRDVVRENIKKGNWKSIDLHWQV